MKAIFLKPRKGFDRTSLSYFSRARNFEFKIAGFSHNLPKASKPAVMCDSRPTGGCRVGFTELFNRWTAVIVSRLKTPFRYGLWTIVYGLLAIHAASAQTNGPITLSSSGTTGTYISNRSVTLSPGFTSTAPFSASIQAIDCIPGTASPTLTQNYVITSSPRIAGLLSEGQLAGQGTCNLMQSVQYVDGLGRPVQTIQVMASPFGYDMVQPQAYDQYGREVTKYLPYTPSSGTPGAYRPYAVSADQGAFYNRPPAGVVQIPTSGQAAYAATKFDNSPLNRPIEQGEPGLSWQLGGGHTVRTSYNVNTSTDAIKLWVVNSSGGASYSGSYPAGTLTKTITTDENGNATVQFADIDGRIVCKEVATDIENTTFLTTYYIYDDLNNLRYVLPPLPSTSGSNPAVTLPSSFTEADAVFLSYFFAYHFDGLKRLIEKKAPGKGWEYVVYNNMDQPILTQDATQLAKGIWILNKFDALGRIVMMGEYASTASRATLQANADAYSGVLYETFTNATTNYGYSHISYPDITIGTGNKVLAVDYYDSYDIINNASVNPGSSIFAAPSATVDSLDKHPRTLPVAELVNVLGTSNYLFTVIQYDKYGREVKKIAQNYQGASTAYNKYDTEEIQYNFQSMPTTSVRKHYLPVSSTPQLTINNNITYDHSNRQLLATQQYITPTVTGPVINLSKMNYNELGQLITKHLHNAATGTPVESGFLQHVDYRYNARGWLTRINDPTNGNYTDETYTNQLDVFAESMDYDQLNNGFGGAPQYNGNISTVKWHTKLPSSITLTQEYKGFTFSYDPLNRLIQANSMAQTTGNGQFNESISYDELGNIVNLTRQNGLSNTLNNLTYNYTSGGVRSNKLTAVTDAGTEGVSSNYAYDANGNLISDSHKTVSAIAYNEFNLPSSVTVTTNNKTITYNYDASGEKLERIIKTGSTVVEDRTYDNGIEYVGNNIEFVQTPEGRALPSAGGYILEYQLTDHLGNIRAMFGDKNNDGILTADEITQNNDYYAFGRDISYSQNLVPTPDNKYKYNGQEFQADLSQYDYGARHYDPVIGRWNVIDIMSEYHWNVSPYSYALNNPVNFADELGLDTITQQQAHDRAKNGNLYNGATNLQINLDEVSVTSTSTKPVDGGTLPEVTITPDPSSDPKPNKDDAPKPANNETKGPSIENVLNKLANFAKQPYDFGGTGVGNPNSEYHRKSIGIDCSCYISTAFGDKGRTWRTADPPPSRWGLTKVNIGSTKNEIRKNLKNGDLIVWYKKTGIHHAGVYFNKGMYNSHGKQGKGGPGKSNDLGTYYLNDKTHPEIPIPTIYRKE